MSMKLRDLPDMARRNLAAPRPRCRAGLPILAIVAAIMASMPALPARALDYDLLSPETEGVIRSDTLRREIDEAYFEPCVIAGVSCLLPHAPKEMENNLTELIEDHPDEAALYLERGRARYNLLDFEGAEQDFIAWSEKSQDRRRALEDLSDFYLGRARPRDALNALHRSLEIMKQNPGGNKAGVSATIGRILELDSDHRLGVDRPAYKRVMVDLYPGDIAAALDYLDETGKTMSPGDFQKLARELMARFPDKPEGFLRRMAESLRSAGEEDAGIDLYEEGLEPLSSAEAYEDFIEMIEEWDRYLEYRGLLVSRAGELDTRGRAMLFHAYLEEGDSESFTSLLDDWQRRLDPADLDGLRVLAEYRRRGWQPRESARLLYRGAVLAPEDEKAAWLEDLFGAVLKSREPLFPLPGSAASLFNDRSLDPRPGVAGGVLSLLLNGSDPAEGLDHIARVQALRGNLELAGRIREQAEELGAGADVLADMDHAYLQRLSSLGYRHEEAGLARDFVDSYPGDPRAWDVELLLARALFDLGRADEAEAAYLDLLSKSKDDEARYLTALGDYASKLREAKKTEKMIAFYWERINARPEMSGSYDQFLKQASNLNLGDEELRIYREASRHVEGPGWHKRLARFYLKKRMTAEYRATLDKAISSLPPGQVAGFIDSTIPDWPFNTATIELKASLYLAAHHRDPRRTDYMLGYLRQAGKIRNPEKCGNDAECLRPVLDFALRVLPLDESLGGAASRELFDGLAHAGSMPAMMGLAGQAMPEAARDIFLAGAYDRLSMYERGADCRRRLAGRYPASAHLRMDLADRLKGLSRARPNEYGGAEAEAKTALVALSELFPSDPSYLLALGELEAESGRVGEAAEWWRKVPATAPGSVERRRLAIEPAWSWFQYGAALEMIDEARADFESPALLSLEKGAIHEDMGNTWLAADEYIRALSLGERDLLSRLAARLSALAKDDESRTRLDGMLLEAWRGEGDRELLVKAHVRLLEGWNMPDRVKAVLADALDFETSRSLSRWLYEKAIEAKSPGAAEKALIKLLESGGGRPEDHIALVRFYRIEERRQDMLARAREMSSKIGAMKSRSRQVKWFRELSDELWRGKARNEALSSLRTARDLSQGPRFAEMSRVLALRLLEAGQPAEAGKALSLVLDAGGWDPEIFRLLMDVYAERGDRIAAEELNIRSREMVNEEIRSREKRTEALADIHLATAKAMIKCDLPARALDYYVEYLNRDPADMEKLRRVYMFAASRGLENKLIDRYTRIAEEANKDYRWSLVCARLQRFVGNRDKALAAYRSAIRNEPGKAELYSEQLPLLAAQGEFSAAALVLEQMAGLGESAREARLHAISMRLRAGDEEEAARLIEEASAGAKTHSELFELARTLSENGRPDLALPLCEDALKRFEQHMDRATLSGSDLHVFAMVQAAAGTLPNGLSRLSALYFNIKSRRADPANKYFAWRLDKSLAAIEDELAGPLADAFISQGDHSDSRDLAEWIDTQEQAGLFPSAALFRMAENAGLADKAATLLQAARAEMADKSALGKLPKMSRFWRERLAWDRAAMSSEAGLGRVNCLLWAGERGRAREELLELHKAGKDGSAGLRMLVKDAADKDDTARLDRLFAVGGKLPEKANILLELDRPEYAVRALSADPRQAWSFFKTLLVKLDREQCDPAMIERGRAALGMMTAGDRIKTPAHGAGMSYHEQAVALMKLAEYARLCGDERSAAAFTAAAIEDRPLLPEARRFTAQSLLAGGRHEEALHFFDVSLELNPGDRPSMLGAAVSRLALGQREDALALAGSMAGDTAGASAWDSGVRYQACSLYMLGFEDEALKRFYSWAEASAREDPDAVSRAIADMLDALSGEEEAMFKTELAELLVLIAEERPEDIHLSLRAIEDGWLEGNTVAPFYDQVMKELGRRGAELSAAREWRGKRLDYWLDNGMPDKVLEELTYSADDVSGSLSPENAERRARALIKKGAAEQAEAFLENWTGADSVTAERPAVIYRAFCKEGLHERADEAGARIWELKLTDPMLGLDQRLSHVRYIYRLGDKAALEDALERIALDYPLDPAALAAAADIAAEAGLYERALSLRESALGADPSNGRNETEAIRLLALLSRHDDAAKRAKKMLQSRLFTNNEKIGLADTLGEVMAAGDDEFRRSLAEAAGSVLGPEGPSETAPVLVFRASVASGSGDDKAAESLIGKAADLAPELASRPAADRYLALGYNTRALRALERGLFAAPGSRPLRARLVIALLRMELNRKALAAAGHDYNLLNAGHGGYFDKSEALDLLHGGDLPLSLEIEAIKGLATALVEKERHGEAEELIAAEIEYLDPIGKNDAGYCDHVPGISSGFPYREVHAELNSALLDLKKELSRLRLAEAYIEYAEHPEGDGLRIIERFDNGIEWSWLMDHLARPEPGKEAPL